MALVQLDTFLVRPNCREQRPARPTCATGRPYANVEWHCILYGFEIKKIGIEENVSLLDKILESITKN